jgi:hypothetical protein
MYWVMKRAVIGVPSKCSTLQLGRRDLQLVDQHGAHLRVAVLLDHEHGLVRGDELAHAGREREGAQPQRVEVDAWLASTSSASCMAGLVEPKKITPSRVRRAAGRGTGGGTRVAAVANFLSRRSTL